MNEEETINKCAEKLSALGCEKSGEQLSFLANFLAIAISKGKNADQLNIIGNFIVAAGGLLLAIAAQRASCERVFEESQTVSKSPAEIRHV